MLTKKKYQLVQQRNEKIAHLKDQLQEMKAKTGMEGKYIKKDAEVRVNCTQKRCAQTENEMKEELEVRGLHFAADLVHEPVNVCICTSFSNKEKQRQAIRKQSYTNTVKLDEGLVNGLVSPARPTRNRI